MKKWNNILQIIMMVGILLLTIGCSEQKNNKKQFHEEEKISIVTTIYPMYDFANNIAGDKAEIINLVPVGIEPHDFELTTGDMQLIEQADILIYNGAGMEGFIDKTLDAISNKDLIVVEAAKNIEPLMANGKTDPHTWLSIKNAIKESEMIKNGLVALDKENEEYYESNFEVYKEKLLNLDTKYKEALSDTNKDTIVVSHEAFGYLCNEYDLKQEGIEGLTAESEPNSTRMKEIIEFCKENEIEVIFYEKLVSPKVVTTIANEIGAETMELNPIGGLTPEQEELGMDYISLMEENLEALEKALK